jgi:hypothetical protein
MCLDRNYYNPKVIFLWDAKRQVLMRTPDNSFGQDSHDNYMALGVYCLMFNKRWARVVLWSALKKRTFMRNDFIEEGGLWKSFMGRFPHVWMIFVAAAFPWKPVKWLIGLGLRLVGLFNKLNLTDASGTQLTWLRNYTLSLLGHKSCLEKFLKNANMAEVMSGYYETGHPILIGYSKLSVK